MENLSIQNRKVKSFLNTEVKEYAQYVISTRALPNIMDGLRVGARKIIFATMTGDLSKSKKVKMPSLIGDTMKLEYNHGDASLVNTIMQLCMNHVCQLHPLDIIGQIGTLRVPKCETAARYLYVEKSPNLEIFKMDFDLMEQKIEEGKKVEPHYMFPIVPMHLLWRTSSPGFGFSFRAFSYSLDSVIDNCIMAITSGSCYMNSDLIQLIPTVPGIKPENMIYNQNKDSWYNVGEYEMNYDNDTMVVTDLPFNISSEKYEEHLNNLVEENYINKFLDLSLDGNIKYQLYFPKGRLKLLSGEKWKFFQRIKLFSKIPKDTLNIIDNDGKKILFFDTPYELIDAFVKRRLDVYQQRKTRLIRIIKERIALAENQIKFINMVINEEIIINKRPIVAIKQDLDKHGIIHDVLKLKIDKLTKDKIDELEQEIRDMYSELDYIQNSTIEEMYIRDLVALKQSHSKITKVEA